jgi:E3 ubiquitin-protein ligase KEG
MGVAFSFRSRPFLCSMTDMEKVSPFKVGQEIRVMPSITQPLLGWSNESPATFGTVAMIDMDGTLNVSMLIFCITLRSLFVFLHVCV